MGEQKTGGINCPFLLNPKPFSMYILCAQVLDISNIMCNILLVKVE